MRLAFVGDSITDGHTLNLHVEQALEALNEKAVCFNAGVSGDRADQILNRLARDVLPLQAEKVFVNAGVNDAVQGIAPSRYGDSLQKIIDMLQLAGSEVVLVTPTTIAAEYKVEQILIRKYTDIQRHLARKNGLLIADVGAAMNAAKFLGAYQLLAPDGIHLEESGYTCMAAAILAVLGYPDAPLCLRPRWDTIQGLIRHWTLTLDDGTQGETRVSRPVLNWTVPELDPSIGWWGEQERVRGYAQSFKARIPGSLWQSESELPPGDAFTLWVGGHVLRVTLDGNIIYDELEWRGWHMRPVSRISACANYRKLELDVAGAFAAACQPNDPFHKQL